MIDLEKLNKSLNKEWKTEEEIDWVYVAKHMEPDLKFMKENAINLRPSFVVENPALTDERGQLTETYKKWINFYNKNIVGKEPKESYEIIDYINKMIEEDQDFSEDAGFECMDTCVGFCGMDQGELYHGKIYLNNSDEVISMDDPWEKTKEILLKLYKRGEDSSDFWGYMDDLEGMPHEELILELGKYREVSEEEKDKNDEDLVDLILDEYNKDDND